MTDQLEVLRTSVVRLRGIVEGLDPGQLAAPAYPTEWTIADVLSHLGSGAVIFQRWFDDALAGRELPPVLPNPSGPSGKRSQRKRRRPTSSPPTKSSWSVCGHLPTTTGPGSSSPCGAMTFDFAGFVGLRLNEHALHTWDIEVALDPGAAVAPGSAGLVVDNLQMMVRFTGKPTGTEHTVAVRTSEPRRDFVIVIGADAVLLEPAEPVDEPDLLIPAEAFIRLVYGRLDPGHARNSRASRPARTAKGLSRRLSTRTALWSKSRSKANAHRAARVQRRTPGGPLPTQLPARRSSLTP